MDCISICKMNCAQARAMNCTIIIKIANNLTLFYEKEIKCDVRGHGVKWQCLRPNKDIMTIVI